MKVVNKLGFLGLLIILVFCTGNASAIYLPESQHHEGLSDFGTDDEFATAGYSGSIKFAVYDTQNNPDDWGGSNGLPEPGTGRFIYAYQISTNFESTAPVEYFQVFSIGAGAIIEEEAGIGTQEDWADDSEHRVDAVDQFFSDDLTKAFWRFEPDSLVEGTYSWFLIFSSDQDWTAGDYSFEAPEGEDSPFPVPVVVPEPCTLMLLTLGGMMLISKRKRSF